MTKVYLKYLFKNPMFYICILLVTGTAIFQMINRNIGTGNSLFYAQNSAVTSIDILILFNFERKIFAFLSAIPFNARFSSEWLSNSKYYIVARKNADGYIRSHLIVCCISSFLVVALGLTIYSVIISANVSLYNSNDTVLGFEGLFEKGYYIAYLALKIILYSLSNTLWCVCGLLSSVFFTNTYIALCSPFIFGFIIENLTYHFPQGINVFAHSTGTALVGKSVTVQIILSFLFWAITISAVGFLFIKFARRKILNADS